MRSSTGSASTSSPPVSTALHSLQEHACFYNYVELHTLRTLELASMYNDVVSSFCSTAEVNAVSMETISYPVHQEDNTQSADIVLDFKTLIGLRYYDVMLVHI